jgi:hypothetical protein
MLAFDLLGFYRIFETQGMALAFRKQVIKVGKLGRG